MCLASTIEVDGGTHNIRVFRNRLTCCYFGVSTQPIYGGPAYDQGVRNRNGGSGLGTLGNQEARLYLSDAVGRVA